MAKITMDSSEWEAMKKVERLLEESLVREKELSANVEKLQQEKIEALEANEKMVTIKKTVISSETIQCKNDPDLIMRRLFGIIANGINESIRSKRGVGHVSIDEIESSWRSYSHLKYMGHEFRAIQDLLFTEKHELRELEDRSEVIHKGLGQVKAEIAQEYEDSMSNQHKEMISDHKDLVIEVNKRIADNTELNSTVKMQGKVIRDLEKDVKKLSKQNDLNLEKIASLSNNKVVSLTRKILSDTRGFVANGKRLKELDEVWKIEED